MQSTDISTVFGKYAIQIYQIYHVTVLKMLTKPHPNNDHGVHSSE